MKNVHWMIVTIVSIAFANALVLFISPLSLHAQETTMLETGKSIEREIANGQPHTYQLTLTAGQFMRVVVAQHGIDVTVRLVAPDGNQIIEVDSPLAWVGQESLSHKAHLTGNYQIIIKATESLTSTGSYQLMSEVKATSSPEDKMRIDAQELLAEIIKQRRQSFPSQQFFEKAHQALSLFRQLNDREGEASLLYFLCFAYRVTDPEKAIEAGETVLALLRQLNAPVTEGQILNNLGGIYSFLGKREKSMEQYERALTIYREAKLKGPEASSLMLIGNEYRVMSQFQKALEYHNQALAAYREAKSRIGEANTLNQIGDDYDLLQAFDKMRDDYEQALAIHRELKNRQGIAFTLSKLSHAYSHLNRAEKVIEYAEASLKVCREIGNRAEEANTLQFLALGYRLLNQPEKTLEYQEQRIAIYRELKNQYWEGFALTSIGRTYSVMNQHEKAVTYYSQGLTVFRQIKHRLGEAVTLNNIGVEYRLLGQYEMASNSSAQALRLQREIKNQVEEANAHNNLMLTWQGMKQPSLAIFFGKQAVNIYQEVRSTLSTLDHETQRDFLKSKEQTYRDLADLLISQGRLPEAEQVIRMLKEEEYFDYIRRDETNSPKAEKAALTPEEVAIEKRYREIADKLSEIGTERSTLLEKKSRTPEEEQRLAKLEVDLTIAGQMFQKFLDGLANELGKNAEASNRVFQLRESQGMMEALRDLGKGTVALYTLVGEDKYRVILTTADVQKGFEYPIKAADLNRKILAFRDVLQNPKLDPLPLAQELYKILVAPLAKDLKAAKAETLMWSLDGVLRYVPMAALHDGEKYLVERWRNVVFTPASQTRLKDEVSRNWKALGLGVTKAHGERIPALPGVLEEMRGIIRADGATSGVLPGTIKLDEQFTQEAMLTGLRQRPPVVHVASHFQFKPGNETDSALLLGDGQFLSLANIKALPNVFSGVELLTLSACNTATGGSGANGKEVEGFGVLAQRQGAKAVIASLWPVADRSTKNLMQEFYKLREAKASTTKAEAMRQAQIKLLRGELQVTGEALVARSIVHEGDKTTDKTLFKVDPKAPYAHPYYWAPFILIGNWK